MKVYISGPITGIPNNNAEAFEEAELDFTIRGFDVINPLKINVDNIEKNLGWKEYMIADIIELLRCDYINMLPNWTKSKGALLEKAIADGLGIKELK
jgi:hypothetical protein